MAETLEEELIRHEGWRNKPYRCSEGYLTIGVGINLDAGLFPEEIDWLLKNRIKRCKKELGENFPLQANLATDAWLVLINMCFNLGITRLKGFKRMWAALEARDYAAAADEMLDSKWAKQVGNRAQELADKMRNCA